MIRFLLDRELIELDDIAADLTVLDWLRIHRQRTGTKEGCGSGDCGACTVVIASVGTDNKPDSPLVYQSINSCITFIGALHGKQLLTVESLATDETLHPVQQCLVDEHGSQCGFCTPGFIMSMYALYQQDEATDVLQARVDQALGGNLCRCTGYKPIKRAADRALQARDTSSQAPAEADSSIVTRLKTMSATPAMVLQDNNRQQPSITSQTVGFYQPDTLQALADFYQQYPEARLLAGGTDLALEVTQQMKDLPLILSLNAVPELAEVEVTDSHLYLGSAVTLTRCMAVMESRIPGAHELLLRFGSDQVRNQGTIGGNIGSASPIGDLPPLLIALDAVLVLQCGDNIRELPLESHFLGYRQTTLQAGEFIRAVRLNLPQPTSVFAIHKISKRTDDDISSVCMAVHLPIMHGRVLDSRVVFGGMAATTTRARQAEDVLNGSPFDQVSVSKAKQALCDELHPISDARASAAYRMQVAQNLLQRVLLNHGAMEGSES